MSHLPFEDSRRLTGPNPWIDRPGVALEVLGGPPAAAALERWQGNVERMLRALDWPVGEIRAWPHGSGASLVFAAPADRLYCATEVNEWAWGVACGTAVGAAPGHPSIHDFESARRTLAALAREEASPALLNLLEAAHQRHLPALVGEDLLTLGTGRLGRDFELDRLPQADAVPWSALGAVPAALVTGSNGKTTTVRLLAAMLGQAGRRVGHSCTDGLFVAGEELESGDYSGPIGARTVLRRRDIDAAVLETARGGLLRRGLALDQAAVAVVTNISADHYGQYGVHDLAGLAFAKLAVARAIGPGGLLILNADDPTLRDAAPGLQVPLGWFSLEPDAAPSAPLLAVGPACFLRAGRLWLHPQGSGRPGLDLGEVARMPLTAGGHARYNIANLAAAALAGHRLGLEPGQISASLMNFGACNTDNRGRLERWNLGGVQVFLDFAHNPEGLDGFLAVVDAARGAGRLGLSLGHAGDRSNAELESVARVAARHRPDRVVLKEIAGYERGRAPGEVPAILRQALEASGVTAASIEVIIDEFEAARALLDWARPGDVLALPTLGSGARDRLIAWLDATT